MRNYLFRGKTESGTWVYGSLIKVGNYCCILEEDDGVRYEYPYLDPILGTIDGQAIPVKPETVGQWTGLVDKNGKKIFEGDILKWETLGTNYMYLVVEFDNGGYVAKSCDPDMKHRKIRLGGEQEYCDVICNRWDNPEYLKGEVE